MNSTRRTTWAVIAFNESIKGTMLFRNKSHKAAKWFAHGFNKRSERDGQDWRAVVVSLTPGKDDFCQSDRF